jgi:hypothetical protein
MVTLSKEFESLKVESVFFFTSSIYRIMLNVFQCPEIDYERRNQIRLFISMTFDDAMIQVYQSKLTRSFHKRKWYSETTATTTATATTVVAKESPLVVTDYNFVE